MIVWPQVKLQQIICCAKRIQVSLFFIVITLTLCYLFFFIENPPEQPVLKYLGINCYENDEGNVIPELSSTYIRKNKTLFFIETTCHTDGIIYLNARQACSIESAALLNPHLDILLLFPSPVNVKDLSSVKYLAPLIKYTNFKVRHIQMSSFFNDTPFSQAWNLTILKVSNWPKVHTSDILRYTLLWKYGGIYADLDFIMLKTFGNLTNFAGTESFDTVGSAILSFGYGTRYAELCIRDLMRNFNGQIWAYNGPGVITRVTEMLCPDRNDKESVCCEGFTVFDRSKFYPIHWNEFELYFIKENPMSTMARLKDSIGVHLWNNKSNKYQVTKGSRQPYSLLAANHCPKIYNIVDEVF